MASNNSTVKTLGIIAVATLGAVVILGAAAAATFGMFHLNRDSGGTFAGAGNAAVTFEQTRFAYLEALWVDTPSAAVRRQPSLMAPALATLSGGAELRELEEHGDWVHVAMPDGTTGWIHEDMVDDDPPRLVFVKVPEATVRSSRMPMGRSVARLAAGTAIQQLARAGDSYQVQLADGRVGFVAKAAVTDDRPERVVVAIPQATLFSAPGRFSRATTSLPYGTELVAFDEEDDHYLVRTADGSLGWIDEDCVARVRL